jgi:hypothetical protein
MQMVTVIFMRRKSQGLPEKKGETHANIYGLGTDPFSKDGF